MLTKFYAAHVYSHCTSTFIVCEVPPQLLVASHLYSPASPLVIFISVKTFVVVRWPSGLIQDTFNGGSPDAGHVRFTLFPSVIVLLSLACRDGDAKDQETGFFNLYSSSSTNNCSVLQQETNKSHTGNKSCSMNARVSRSFSNLFILYYRIRQLVPLFLEIVLFLWVTGTDNCQLIISCLTRFWICLANFPCNQISEYFTKTI